MAPRHGTITEPAHRNCKCHMASRRTTPTMHGMRVHSAALRAKQPAKNRLQMHERKKPRQGQKHAYTCPLRLQIIADNNVHMRTLLWEA